MIGVVVDGGASAGDLQNVIVVPMPVTIDSDPGAAPTPERILAEIRRGSGRIQTAAPSPGAFLEAMGRADQGDGVVVLTVSSKMSSSWKSATLAAGLYKGRVEVIDTGTAAGGETMVAMAAATEARSGGSFDAVVKGASDACRDVRVVAHVGDLRPLSRGGRLPGPVAGLANAVGLRPVFEFRRGSIRILRPALSPGAAMQTVLSAWRSSLRKEGDNRAALHVTAMHADDEAAARVLLEAVRHEIEPATAFVSRFGPVMIAHVGGDVVGLAWWWERHE